ncbi:beta-aspartyl-dipeptidase (metallo-type) [Clostridium amylolyticum]|uniref:Isoaspartyl dipeptidase n=1 Tax=Clostridium amylolyticum TaxID=1121298 RepID=A0A1M6HHY8_9CLOT|nr:beta-aspartyl-peptidase [Clostridium amylolyticum]SHJ21798.1 beta-aspartyl-dipeptidase (metallo-type) [Clostridium amylolyticum]
MITIIKNADIYAPEPLGIKQVVILEDRIEGIYDDINIPENFIEIKVVDAEGKILVPGFIDNHVHILGGGGEGGFKTRTPELSLSKITTAGITTVVGCLGTDDVCRDIRALVAKANALEEEGISTYIYTGSYEIPVKSLTGSPKGDLMMVSKAIGVGEIALSDHRSSQPTYEQFVNTVAQARVGGLLSGKAGVVNVHLGDGATMMEYLFTMISKTEIPATQVLPTHINRIDSLFEMGIEYTKAGGFIDLTTSSEPNFLEPGEVKASKGLKLLLDAGVPIERITFSSDGNGSMPLFDKDKKFLGLGICSVETLFREVRDAVLEENIPLGEALKVITSNAAEILKLKAKGSIEKGKDADLVLLDKATLNIHSVMAKGVFHIENNKVIVKGTFE